jgi:hypothetical protein
MPNVRASKNGRNSAYVRREARKAVIRAMQYQDMESDAESPKEERELTQRSRLAWRRAVRLVGQEEADRLSFIVDVP